MVCGNRRIRPAYLSRVKKNGIRMRGLRIRVRAWETRRAQELCNGSVPSLLQLLLQMLDHISTCDQQTVEGKTMISACELQM